MPVSKNDVARAAVQLEKDGRTFYLEVAEQTKDDLARKMFAALADDELDHIAWIEKAVPGVDSAESANRSLYARLKHIFADVPEEQRRTVATAENDVNAIHVALGMEKQSVDAYQAWADEAEDQAVRDLCRVLADIERFHIQVLNNTLEYFEHTPDWFMQEEQWNFEGA